MTDIVTRVYSSIHLLPSNNADIGLGLNLQLYHGSMDWTGRAIGVSDRFVGKCDPFLIFPPFDIIRDGYGDGERAFLI